MSLREEQCNKVCTILDNVLANRPTERDSLIVAVRKAFAEPKRGKWERHYSRPNVYADLFWHCSECGYKDSENYAPVYHHFCPNCGAKMEVTT